MKIRVSYESHPLGPGVKPFGRRVPGVKERRLMFDNKLMIHTTNTIAGVVQKIKLTRTPISLQRISIVPV
jgi:hypothetical protein